MATCMFPPSPAAPETIAGSATLDDVLARLRGHRPVFHSEADLQHSFALAVHEVAREVGCRLEVPVRGSEASEYLDLLCLGPAGRTAVEFKYVTRRWSGTVGSPPEEYALRGHNAPDLARRDFVRDVGRLERFCEREDQNGLALLITNEASLWSPRQRTTPTRDEEFRIHEERELSGTLLWAGGSFPANTRVLRGTYLLRWRPYAQLGGPNGEFRCLAVFVAPAPAKLSTTAPHLPVPGPGGGRPARG
ncbi:hypothetical protein [Streptomyces sp. AM 2-1-1]|uniref:hypothetical protein n=1 Tax=Streptomyces sp. AM 2-1-1 TaxID=3028709 RepID=UPI0023B8C899|nr:hypothetical protein [Streptomyces sp. AM 2-1-1]WEH40363.1 hypothetical protein PZB77_13040 [Streptomyces sp. AM 2-1-1]